MSLSTELVETKFVAEHESKQQYHLHFFDSNLNNMKKTWKGITVISVHLPASVNFYNNEKNISKDYPHC